MPDTKIGLYKLAKFTNLEIVLESQIQSSGANQSRLLERYKKNKNSVKTQVIAMRFAYGFIFGMIAILPIINYFQLIDFINNSTVSIEAILFSGSLIFGLFFGMQLIYLTFMGMFAIGAMMSGEVFRWYETLPLSKNKLQKLGFLTVLRNLDLAFLMMILSFPLIMGIISQDFILTLTSALISVIQVVFAFSVLILTAEKVSRILKVESAGSRKATMIRILTMLAYVMVVMTASLFIQWAVNAMGSFFIMVSSIDIPYIIIFLLGMIPFPFAPSFLITILINPSRFPSIQWISVIIGMGLLIILTILIYKRAIKSMRFITSSASLEMKQSKEKRSEVLTETEMVISIKKVSPIKAYLKKDLSTATRDIQMFMFLLMPLIMPLLVVFVFAFIPSGEFGGIQFQLIATWSFLMFYQPMISLMIISGFLNVEDTGASITASLPLNPREQVKAKLTLLLTIQSISFFIPVILISILNPSFKPYIPFFIAWYPIALVFLFNGFNMKIHMFGRMKYKFVLEEVNPERKVLKWALLIITQFAVYVGYVIIGSLLLLFTNIILMTIILLLSSLAILSLLLISLQSMFPKEFGRKRMLSIGENLKKHF